MSHTPGPWRGQDDEVWVGEVHICDCMTYAHDDYFDTHDSVPGNNAANARLIATAPEMYEACKAVIDSALYRYESHAGPYWACRLCNKNSPVDGTVDQIEHTDDCPVPRTIAAIAKAEGEA